MSKWLNYASNLLDSVDSAAKVQLADEEAKLSATERRERRKAELLGLPVPAASKTEEDGLLGEASKAVGPEELPNVSLGVGLSPEPRGLTSAQGASTAPLPPPPPVPNEQSPGNSPGASDPGSFVVVESDEGNEAALKATEHASAPTSEKGAAAVSSSPSIQPQAPLSNNSAFSKTTYLVAPKGRSAKELALEFPELEGQEEKQQIRLLKAEIKRLKEVEENLNLELEDMEIRLEGQGQELRAAGEAIAHATRKNAAREQELLEEISILEKAKEADKKNYLAAMQQKEEDISKARSEVLNSQAEAESTMLTVGELNERIRKLEEDKAALRVEADQAHLAQNQDYGSLRADLRAAEDKIEEMKDQHANWARSAERRQASLETKNTELTQALTEAQKQLDTRTQSYQQLGMQTHVTDAELHALQEELHGVQAALELERQHVHSLQREARNREMEASAARVSHEEDRAVQMRTLRDLKDQLEEKQRQNDKLKSQMQQNSPDTVNIEFEKRLKTITDQLLKKQVQLDETACERATLTAKLKATVQRAEKAEQDVARLREELGGDVEGGLPDATLSARGVRRRLGGAQAGRVTKSIAKLEPIAMNPKVAKAADVIDKFTLQAGSIMRKYPEARLAFLFYLLMLHLWALFMLVYNAHNIEELHADTGGQDIIPHG
mmetsp:Transcript_37032/g.46635  ORF Transcript_37032/g.46635 Transcript_37032/m.46635 type:complete len:669 (+) Transcript_37032:91-2097(+)